MRLVFLVVFLVLGFQNLGVCQVGPPARIDECWVIETKGCFDLAQYQVELQQKVYCETTPCERNEEKIEDNGVTITRVWYSCPKRDAVYMTSHAYQERRRVFGDTIGIKETMEDGRVDCRIRLACQSKCNGPGNCERGSSVLGYLDERISWQPSRLNRAACRGPVNPPLGPVIVD